MRDRARNGQGRLVFPAAGNLPGSGFSFRTLLLTMLVYAGITLDLVNHGTGDGAFVPVRNVLGSFRGFEMTRALLIPGIYLILRKAPWAEDRRTGLAAALPAFFFAMNMAVGFAFEKEGSWDMLVSLRDGQLLKAILACAGWGVLFDRLLLLLFKWLESAKIRRSLDEQAPSARSGGFHLFRRYEKLLRQHSFAVPFLTLLLLYLPHIVISYPAMFMGDTGSMIVQAYSELGMTGVSYLDPEDIIRAGVFINQHHPVFYTLLLHGFLVVGDALFHSLNAGLFLCALGQALLMMAAFSWAVSALARRQVSVGWLMLAIGYAFIHPQVHNFMLLVTKEGPYAACFMLMMTGLFRLKTGERNRRTVLVLGFSVLGVLLLRNEGRYVLLMSGLLMAAADRKNRKKFLLFALASLAVGMGVSGIYRLLGYTPGSIRETLSVPMQQTARFVRDHPEDVTEEERDAIDGVLVYDELAEAYEPELADPVKELYRKEADTGNLIAWLKAWAGMLIRHPDTFIQATYANYDQFFYPGEVRLKFYTNGWTETICDYTNELIAGLGKQFVLPAWSRRIRILRDSFIEAGLLELLPLSLLMTPAMYYWAVLALICWAAGRKKRVDHAGRSNPGIAEMLIPPAVALLITLLGPANGSYGRYLLPVTAFLPVLISMTLILRDEDKRQAEDLA